MLMHHRTRAQVTYMHSGQASLCMPVGGPYTVFRPHNFISRCVSAAGAASYASCPLATGSDSEKFRNCFKAK